MGKMMEAAVAETMQFGVADLEEDLYSPYAHIAASEFDRQPFAHHEEYVGGMTAKTREYTLILWHNQFNVEFYVSYYRIMTDFFL